MPLLSESGEILPIHRRILAFTFIGWIFDFYDLLLLTFLVSSTTLVTDLALSRSETGVLLGTALAFTAVGGVVRGAPPPPDGRQPPLCLTPPPFNGAAPPPGAGPHAGAGAAPHDRRCLHGDDDEHGSLLVQDHLAADLPARDARPHARRRDAAAADGSDRLGRRLRDVRLRQRLLRPPPELH